MIHLTDIPEGWAWGTVEELGAKEQQTVLTGPFGTNLKSSNFTSKGVPVLTIGCLTDEGIDLNKAAFLPPNQIDSLERYKLKSGDMLFSRMASVGRACIVPDELEGALFNYHIMRLRFSSEIYESTLFIYYVRGAETVRQYLEDVNHGATRDGINTSQLLKMPVLIPPRAEQIRIVTRLEELLSTVSASRKRLNQVPRLLKQFRQSVLAAAFSGRLTASWRESSSSILPASEITNSISRSHEEAGGHKRGNAAAPTEDVHTLTKESLPDSWEVTDLKNLCEPERPITYGILMPGPDIPNGVPYVRVADFPNDKLNTATIKRTTVEIDAQYARARLRAGDILLSIRGTVGRVCVIPEELAGANITQDAARLSIQKEMDGSFVTWALRAPSTQQRMQRAIKGVAVRGINIGDVRALQIPIPPLDEQQEIVRRIEAFFKIADTVEDHYRNAQEQLDKLPQAILAKAFRGELIPQDPNDEPASALLERIRAERVGTAKPERKARRQSAIKSKRAAGPSTLF